MVCFEIVRARGHRNISARHDTTIEVTRDKELTPRGDCIIGVDADKASGDFSHEFKKCITRDFSFLIAVFEVDNIRDYVIAEGSPRLLLSDLNKIIIRKSTYIEPATIGIRANKAARDLRRDLIERLKNPDTTLIVYLYVLSLDEITSIYPGSRSILHYKPTSDKLPSPEDLSQLVE